VLDMELTPQTIIKIGGGNMKISEFSNKSNLSIDTIRYYEKLGLLKVNKLANNRKDYTEDDLGRLKVISSLKMLNLSLSDIAKLFELNDLYDNSNVSKDEKVSIIKESEIILKKAYSNLLEIESQVKASKQLLEKSISKIDMALENIGDMP
jgi:MerR family Zn(II)-responsive transcriptional regulator of zntA